MTVIFGVLVVKAFKIEKNKNIKTILIVLLLCGLSWIWLATSQYNFYLKENYTTIQAVFVGLASGLSGGCTCISHYMLALQYREIAKDVPSRAKGEGSVQEQTADSFPRKTLWVLNLAAGPLKAFSVILTRNTTNV